ncbi:MAG: tRNA pseudouridine(38-40) synthase TruA [Acidobacteria bacterium]|nr:tRNA pseudouridine(38-40) synthase TruA [Acidobacteriota bacterium]
MPRFKLTLEYAGTRYSGWQSQKNAKTVQGELNRAIVEALGDVLVDSQGSGRTDAGVHALAQVAHIDVTRAPAPEALRRRINDGLPADIHVIDVAPVGRSFHARHSAVHRSYLYQISRRRSAFAKPYVWWVKETLDLTRMRAAADAFAGLHDFRAFSDDAPDEKSTKVLLDEVTLVDDGALVLVRVAGSHFLWKMVRRMVGVLAAVGTGDLEPGDVAHLLGGDGGDAVARLTAPAAGLFLERVLYPGDAWPVPIVAAVPVR